MATAVVIGGSGGIGLAVARHLATRADEVVVTSRDAARASEAAAAVGPRGRGIALDLGAPGRIAEALAGVGDVSAVVLTAIEPGAMTLAGLDTAGAVQAVTVKLVGYAEAVRVLHPALTPEASVVLFGGLAKDRPYPGSTLVTVVNAGVTGLTRTLAAQIAPHRVNAIHPGVVGDSPRWRDLPTDHLLARTPTGRLTTVEDVVGAVDFLLGNPAVNAHELILDGGASIT